MSMVYKVWRRENVYLDFSKFSHRFCVRLCLWPLLPAPSASQKEQGVARRLDIFRQANTTNFRELFQVMEEMNG